MLLRKCRKVGLLIPTLQKNGQQAEGVAYEGATVIEVRVCVRACVWDEPFGGVTRDCHASQPKKGFYDEPIATLDFASLYPSIMMANNLCYSTLVARDDVAKMKPEDVKTSPSGDVFVRSSVRKVGFTSQCDPSMCACTQLGMWVRGFRRACCRRFWRSFLARVSVPRRI